MRIIALLIAIVLVGCQSKSTFTPQAPNIWIAATNYGTHIGTYSNPFDGSTAAKFDTLMQSFPPFTTINLMAGTFETTGSKTYNDALGWYVKPGWKVRGRGWKQTLIRQITYPAGAVGVWHGTFEMDMYDPGGVEISNLTVDENWPAFHVPSNTSTFAVALRGDNNTIRNVRAVNGYGNRASLLESFSITCGSRYHDGWEVNTNGLIEGCSVGDYRGDYGVAIALMPTVKGRVRNCAVTNFIGTSPFGMSSGVIYENNTTVGCFGGYYTDTGWVEDVVIRKCRMLKGTGFAVHSNPILGDCMVMNVLVEDCYIESSGTGIALSGQLGPGYQYNFTFRRNTFTGTGSPIVAAWTQGLVVTDNFVKDGAALSVLRWAEYPSFGVVSKRNYRLPPPTGLEDYP